MTNNLGEINNTSFDLIAIADRFTLDGKVTDVRQYGSGNINSTFLVTLDAQPPFILQRINTRVFCQPELVMNNMCVLSDYVSQRLKQSDLSIIDRRWLIPQVLSTSQQQNYWIAEDRSFWRAISFIDNSQSFDTIQDIQHGQEIGYGLGMFHSLINDLPVEKLADTLEGFHVTPNYLQHYHGVINSNQIESSPEIDYCLKFISDRPDLPHVLESAKAAGKIHLRTIHGDPKINNIMIDCDTKQAVAMIDLDTVKPGLIHYDIGDCLRSGCNRLGEETKDWEQVTFDPELAEAILQGYLSVARDFLTDNDLEYIYDSIRLLAFELGLRFLTDNLEGNVYFGADYPEHNLARALVQFKLTESIEKEEQLIRQIIQSLL
ncbi:aminoglycoside phosphotransferase family protein [Waterburya agarophytonicola K14]|uniref:Aminoglycoside phosphotransferase family protein n=1 Tax=Waterburya agarophytonicola KI4 TaxID=2874699 RepID=A0A964FFN0_9CYAN|nr:aminoglycoside phosphotransferase family protein [Waterburya agarophytonicola]MCC0175663.1 aminoglycoside phosphotransferase family protein [Waterburya agarophytonicola KI4]